MEPRIQYTETADGVSVAFSTLGEGMPLVWMPGLMASHVQVEWRIPEMRSFYEHLAENRMVVRYDGRGRGLSQRDVTDFSLDANVLDLEAVVGRLKLKRFALAGTFSMGPVAIAYAAGHPESVSHLVLWCASAQGSDFYDSTRSKAWRALAETDQSLFRRTLAHQVTGWSEGAQARGAAALMRESVTPQTWLALREATREFDVTDLLPQVRSPTLVLQRRELRRGSVAIASSLASRIPDARLVVVEGSSLVPYLGDRDAVLQAIHDFLGKGGAYPHGLTAREVEVLGLIAQGKSNREIAAQLTISPNTVDRHVSNILNKTGAVNRAEAAAYAARRGLAP